MDQDNHHNHHHNKNNEFPDVPEDDDFVDFEGAEDEAPEAVQAMISGPNWVFPDLVRVQSSNSNPQTMTPNDSGAGASNHQLSNNNRTPPRILDPPDVSLLTSSSSKPKPNQTQTLDLCSSIGGSSSSASSSKLMFNNSNNASKPLGTSNGPTSVSSPSSGSSSLSAVISGGPILGSNSSSPSLSTGTFMTPMKAAADNLGNDGLKNHHHFYPIPSTSNGIMTPAVTSELKIRTLQVEKLQLQEQLLEREKQISELERMVNESYDHRTIRSSESRLEEAIGRRIEQSLENIVGTALSDLTYRVERLETISAAPLVNGSAEHAPLSNDESLMQMFQRFKMEQQQERRETLNTLSEILSHALEKVNSLHKK